MSPGEHDNRHARKQPRCWCQEKPYMCRRCVAVAFYECAACAVLRAAVGEPERNKRR